MVDLKMGPRRTVELVDLLVKRAPVNLHVAMALRTEAVSPDSRITSVVEAPRLVSSDATPTRPE